MSDWKKVKAQPGVQTWENPLHPDSVEEVKSDGVQRMLEHAEQQLELTRQYPGRKQPRK
jgi:hypothetical protein